MVFVNDGDTICVCDERRYELVEWVGNGRLAAWSVGELFVFESRHSTFAKVAQIRMPSRFEAGPNSATDSKYDRCRLSRGCGSAVSFSVMLKPKKSPEDPRRWLVLGIAVASLTGSLLCYWFGNQNASTFLAAALGRIGLVLGALWLAWPSLRKPAQWLPSGAAMICLLALIVLAARPRLVVFVIPAAGLLITLGMFVRSSRGQK